MLYMGATALPWDPCLKWNTMCYSGLFLQLLLAVWKALAAGRANSLHQDKGQKLKTYHQPPQHSTAGVWILATNLCISKLFLVFNQFLLLFLQFCYQISPWLVFCPFLPHFFHTISVFWLIHLPFSLFIFSSIHKERKRGNAPAESCWVILRRRETACRRSNNAHSLLNECTLYVSLPPFLSSLFIH